MLNIKYCKIVSLGKKHKKNYRRYYLKENEPKKISPGYKLITSALYVVYIYIITYTHLISAYKS